MSPILWRFVDGSTISTYSVFTALGYLTGIVWLRTQVGNMRATASLFYALVGTLLAAALTGGKLGFFLVEWREFSADPGAMLRDWNTGWVFWSGFLLACLAGYLFQIWHNKTHRPRLYLPVADYFGAALAMGHVLGRLGCWAEGCCHGAPTGLPWGTAYLDPASSVPRHLLGVLLHPTQLYEAFGEAAAAAYLIGRVLPAVRAGKYRYGTAFLGYILYYSVLRFLLEFLRGDDRGVFLWSFLSPSQWVSLGAGLAAAWALKVRGVIERDPKSRTIYADGKP
ncbi:MAG: prolipoprotein diacylglyceryl transferase [Elusimicrobia bacterium]|nr:prolipoprotein diacylglyceryl transferase [Elusimicrobiota bacterium]